MTAPTAGRIVVNVAGGRAVTPPTGGRSVVLSGRLRFPVRMANAGVKRTCRPPPVVDPAPVKRDSFHAKRL